MESSLAFMDDLLDFSSDIGEEDEEDDVVPPFSVKPKSSSTAPADSSELNAGTHPDDSSSCRVLPVSLFFFFPAGGVFFFGRGNGFITELTRPSLEKVGWWVGGDQLQWHKCPWKTGWIRKLMEGVFGISRMGSFLCGSELSSVRFRIVCL